MTATSEISAVASAPAPVPATSSTRAPSGAAAVTSARNTAGGAAGDLIWAGDLGMPTSWGAPASSRPVQGGPGGHGLGVEVPVVGRALVDEVDLEEDGVLPAAGRDLAVLVGVVGTAAAAEAGWNVGQACLKLMHLPLPLAVMFPLVLESFASSCALQDLRDRRRGVRSRALAAGTYIGLAISAAVNGAVGWASHSAAGLLEILPPLVLGALIHLHGQRSERAWRSRAKTRAGWRRAQLEAARIESVSEVLPLLTGQDEDGKATVELLRRRLDSGTLTPAGALGAAGWYQRYTREGMTASRIRRLETVAATVWPQGVPPAPPGSGGASRGVAAASRAASPRGAPTAPAASGSAAPGPGAPDASAPTAGAPGTGRAGRPASARGEAPTAGAPAGQVRTATDEEILAAIAQVWSKAPGAGERPIGQHLRHQGLRAAASKIRPLLQRARAEVSSPDARPVPVSSEHGDGGALPDAGQAEAVQAG
jgi:hypothetical protein